MEKLSQVLDTVAFLATPFHDDYSGKMKGAKSPDSLLLKILETSWSKLELSAESQILVSDSTASACWKLSCTILDVLTQLKKAIEEVEAQQTEEEQMIEVLSLQSQIYVQRCTELIIGFGIRPYMLPGVGISEKARRPNPASDYFSEKDRQLSHMVKFQRLSYALESLMLVCVHGSMNSLVVLKHHPDLLAAFLQICKSPLAKPQSEDIESKSTLKSLAAEIPEPSVSSSRNAGLSWLEYESVMTIRNKLSGLMENVFLVSVPKRILINSLFLIGATKTSNTMSGWVGKTCNAMILDIMRSSNGLIIICQALLESSARTTVWNVSRILSNLLQSSLRRDQAESHLEHVTRLCIQCEAMVRQERKWYEKHDVVSVSSFEVNQEIRRIGLYCAITLMDGNFQVVENRVWHSLFSSILMLINGIVDSPSNLTVIVRTSDIMTCVDIAECLLALFGPMQVTVKPSAFQPIWTIFIKILTMCELYLKRRVQEPTIAQEAEVLKEKLVNVLILLLSVVQSTCPSSRQSEKIEENLCHLCISLILNEWKTATSMGILLLNRFEFQQSRDEDFEGMNDKQLQHPTDAKVKIGVKNRQDVACQINEDNAFEILSDDCAVFCAAVLRSERLKRIIPSFFRQLLGFQQKADDVLSKQTAFQENDSNSIEKCTSSSNLKNPLKNSYNLVELEENQTPHLEDCRKFVVLKLMENLGSDEDLLEKCLGKEDPQEMLGYLELIFKNITGEIETCELTGEVYGFADTLVIALGILGTLCESTTSPKMWDTLQVFVPHLRKLKETCLPHLTKLELSFTTQNILRSIETRSVSGGKKSPVISRYKKALQDVANPMLPVKGHGLLELRRLVEQKDEETLKNDQLLLTIFQKEMKNEDTYVYLMAIKGMAALGLKFHGIVVPALIDEYDFGDNEEDKKRKRAMLQKMDAEERVRFRMKIGEVLVQIIHNLGDIAPVYRVPLTNVFFRLTRDEEPLMRASALSNLGELCHLLKFTLGVVLTEVWHCVESIVSTEKSQEVRRAAVYLMQLVLKGIEQDLLTIDIFKNETVGLYLRDVRRVLTNLYRSDEDCTVRLHAQLGLEQLEMIVRKLFASADKLQFKMKVLDVN